MAFRGAGCNVSWKVTYLSLWPDVGHVAVVVVVTAGVTVTVVRRGAVEGRKNDGLTSADICWFLVEQQETCCFIPSPS